MIWEHLADLEYESATEWFEGQMWPDNSHDFTHFTPQNSEANKVVSARDKYSR